MPIELPLNGTGYTDDELDQIYQGVAPPPRQIQTEATSDSADEVGNPVPSHAANIKSPDNRVVGSQPPAPGSPYDTSSLDQYMPDMANAQDLARRKYNVALIGNIGDALANQQSEGNFFLGRMNPHINVSGAAKNLIGAMPDVEAQKAKALGLLSAYQKAKQGQMGLSAAEQAANPQSPISQVAGSVNAQMAKQLGLDPTKIASLPADQQEYINKQLDTMAQIRAAQANKAAQLAMTAAMLGNKVKQENIKNVTDAYNKLQGDKNYEKLKGQEEEAKTLVDLTNDAVQNPQSAAALATYAARYSTGGQRMNEIEIKNVGGGAKDIMDRLNQIVTTGSKGTLTPENAAFMKRFIAVTSGTAQNNMMKMEDDRAKALGRNMGMEPHEALHQLVGRDQFEDEAEKQAAPKQTLSPQDEQAIQWAKANPSDPRAQKILQMHGAQ